MTLAQLQAAAGRRYAAAIMEIQASYVDLVALDLVLADQKINPAAVLPTLIAGPTQLVTGRPISSTLSASDTLVAQVIVARDAYIAGFTS